MAHKKVFVKWKDVEKYVDELCLELERLKYKPTGVYGIPRGGLVFAVLLSHRLNVPMLASPMGNCIVVDDIADSGRSLVHYRQNDTMFLDTLFITTMYYSERSMVKPNYYMKVKKSQDDWIVFPWETRKRKVTTKHSPSICLFNKETDPAIWPGLFCLYRFG